MCTSCWALYSVLFTHVWIWVWGKRSIYGVLFNILIYKFNFLIYIYLNTYSFTETEAQITNSARLARQQTFQIVLSFPPYCLGDRHIRNHVRQFSAGANDNFRYLHCAISTLQMEPPPQTPKSVFSVPYRSHIHLQFQCPLYDFVPSSKSLMHIIFNFTNEVEK